MMQSMVSTGKKHGYKPWRRSRYFWTGQWRSPFRVPKVERNRFIELVLKRFGYARHERADKLRYLERMTWLV